MPIRRSVVAPTIAATLITAIAMASGAVAAGPAPANRIAIALIQLDPSAVGVQWATTVLVELPDVPGVAGVTASAPDGPDIPLTLGSNGWGATLPFPDLNAMLAATDGAWTVDIAGSQPSRTTFVLDAETLLESNFFPAPQFISPMTGDVVPANAPITWVDPTGAGQADAIAIEVNSDNLQILADSFSGPLTVDSESWTAPVDFEVGALTLAGLFYLNYGDPIGATPYTVTRGSITWSDAAIVPDDYPAMTPRFTWGSANVVSFTASEPVVVPGDVSGDGVVNFADLTLILSAWGPCAGCPADLNGDRTVDLTDLLTVLSNWDG